MKDPGVALQWMRVFDEMSKRLGATFIDRRRERMEVLREAEESAAAPGQHRQSQEALRMKTLLTMVASVVRRE